MTLAMPNKDRWSIVRAMFDAVSGLAASQRDKFLDFACPDASIRAEVESLLAADDSAGDWDLPSDRGEGTGTTEEPGATAPPVPPGPPERGAPTTPVPRAFAFVRSGHYLP